MTSPTTPANRRGIGGLTALINRAVGAFIPLTQKGAANGVATLDGASKLTAAQLPSLRLVTVTSVANQAARLALPADDDAQFVVQTDTAVTWMLPGGANPAVNGNWTALPQPSTAGLAQTANNGSDFADAGTTRYNLHVGVLAASAAVATANVASLSGLQTFDGYTLLDADTVLLTAQSTASQNGPWIAHAGAWARPADYPAGGTVKTRITEIIKGSTYAGTIWGCTSAGAITIDTTATTWIPLTRLATKVTVFTASGTYTPTPGAIQTRVQLIGPGGAGAGGYRSASAAVAPGGGSGAGGAYTDGLIPTADLSVSQSVVIGTGGTGGAGATSDNSAGAAGINASGSSTFGTQGNDFYLVAGRGQPGGAPTSGAGGVGQSGGPGLLSGGNGAAGSAGVSAGSTGSTNQPGGASGGGGGGVTTGNTFLAGGAGGVPSLGGATASAGGATDAAAGTAGASRSTFSNVAIAGNGGGGGAGSVSGVGGKGGDGGFPGGGGGGGGGSRNGNASGAGGNGANGICVITEYF